MKFSDLPGGAYDAKQNSDGTWNIGEKKPIPIMSVVPQGARDNSKVVGEEWMTSTVAKHRMMEKSQDYLAPIHVEHHGDGAETSQAGFLKLTGIEKIWQDGEKKDAIHASFIGVPDEVFQDIKQNKYAYRSVEIAEWNKSEIASLALLSDEAPFFKLPMLSVGEETPNQEPISVLDSAPVVAMQEVGAGGRILFNFSGATTMSQFEAEKKEDDVEEIDIEEDDENEGDAKVEDVSDKDNGDEKKKKDDDDEEEFKEFMALLKAMRKFQTDDGEDSEKKKDDDEGKSFDNGLDIEEDEKELSPVMRDSRSMRLMSDLNRRLMHLESFAQGESQRRIIQSAVKGCLSQLRGYNLPDDLEATMTQIAETAGEHYETTLKQFTETFIASAVPQDDIETLEQFEESMTIGKGEEALAHFAQRGPDALADAKSALGIMNQCKKLGMRFFDGMDDPTAFIEALDHHRKVERDIKNERLNGNGNSSTE